MSGREQEIIMIPALICVVNAISKIDDTNIKAITRYNSVTANYAYLYDYTTVSV